jgi:hypothetical protein
VSRNFMFSETLHRSRPSCRASCATSIVKTWASSILALRDKGVGVARTKFDLLHWERTRSPILGASAPNHAGAIRSFFYVINHAASARGPGALEIAS